MNTPREEALLRYERAKGQAGIAVDVPDRMLPAALRWKNFDPGHKAVVPHTCTLPDGRTATRNSKSVYTHAIAVWDEAPNGGGPAHWGCLSWHSNEALARKTARHWSHVYPKFEIVPATRAPDVVVENCGTVARFTPLTKAARSVFAEKLSNAQTLEGSVVCEHRYASDVAEALSNTDGLVLIAK